MWSESCMMIGQLGLEKIDLIQGCRGGGPQGGSSPLLKILDILGGLSPPLKNPSLFYISHDKT